MVIDEFDELKGRLTLLTIKYPDTSVRLDDTIDMMNNYLASPKEGLLNYLIADLQNLEMYLHELYVIEELRQDLTPVIDLIKGLLAPAE